MKVGEEALFTVVPGGELAYMGPAWMADEFVQSGPFTGYDTPALHLFIATINLTTTDYGDYS